MITAERVRELLDYDSSTGVFRWRRNGKVAGCATGSHPYVIIRIDQIARYAHRLAWLYVFGVWPDHTIDHANGDKHDNRLCNLREATMAQQLQNQGRPGLGATYNKQAGKWTAQISVNRRRTHLGYFDTAEAAEAAYRAAKAELHPFNARP